MARFELTSGNDVFPLLADNSGNDLVFGRAGNDLIEGGAGDDTLVGGNGDDTLHGGQGRDVFLVKGVSGHDVIDGGDDVDWLTLDYSAAGNRRTGAASSVYVDATSGTWQARVNGVVRATVNNVENLVILTGNGADVLLSGSGADFLEVNGGNDRVLAGAGADVVVKTWGGYDLDGGGGWDQLVVRGTDGAEAGAALVFDALAGTIAAGTTTFGTFQRFEAFTVEGTARADSITGGDGQDRVEGGAGDDLIFGGGGSDVLYGGAGVDTIHGGDGADLIAAGFPAAGAEADAFYGGAGNDTIQLAPNFAPGPTSLAGLVVDGGDGRDTLELPYQVVDLDLTGALISGVETLTMSAGSDRTLYISAEQAMQFDTLQIFAVTLAFTTNADVTLFGPATIVHRLQLADGGQRLDISGLRQIMPTLLVTGGDGADEIRGGINGEVISGAEGNDTIYAGGLSSDGLQGVMNGDAGDDLLIGYGGDDLIFGGEGADELRGHDGTDDLHGGSGNDTLTGGLGRDALTGGDGTDIFVFRTPAETGPGFFDADYIWDFQALIPNGFGNSDLIDLSAIDADATAEGNQAFSFILTANQFTGPGQIRAVQIGSTTWLFGNTSFHPGSEMRIALRDVVATDLVALDFLL